MPTELARGKELFFAVVEMSAAERSAHLDSACAGDAALREQVEALLRSHENSGELLPRSPGEMLRGSDSTDNATEADGTAAFSRLDDRSVTIGDKADGDENDLRFLTPTSKPGHLGRLGPYDVQSVLGKGGFGIVLKAFDERLHRVVAIKVLSPAYAASGAARNRFKREARAAAAIKNEHVVGIHDVQGDADPPYLVMEYIDGISLQDKIDKQGALELKEILRVGMQIAEGLAAAHKQGLVHRDIKPANILLENGVERVKITDFGLARAVDDASLTQSGTVAGTPMYMSPEQAEGLPIDHRSDLFSLGTVLYAMCTGHPPFRATGTIAVLKRVIEDTPRPIREIHHEIPEWLCAIITRLHGKKKEDRFQTSKEVAELLGQRLADVQAGRAIEVRGGSVSDGSAADVADASGSSRSKRRLVIAASAVLALVALSAIGWYALQSFFLRPPPDDSTRPGTLTVQTNEPVDLLIERLDPDPKVISDRAQPGSSARVLSVPAGTYRVRATRAGEVLFLDTVRVKAEEQAHMTVVCETGWTHLFNRKNLDGWTTQGDWKVNADGHLVGRGSPRSFAFTRRHDFADFHLRTELMISGGRGGVLFRGGQILKSGRQAGYLASVLGSVPLGSLMIPEDETDNNTMLARSPGGGTRINEWQKIEIIVRGNQITIKVNDHTFQHVDKNETFKSGSIGLETLAMDGILTVKKIEIKELPSAPPAATPPPAVAPFDAAKAKEHQDAWAKHLGVDVETSNSIGMKFRTIPPGKFVMGAPDNGIGRQFFEGPQHEVVLTKPFSMSTHHVTVRHFKEFVKEKGYKTDAEKDGEGPHVFKEGAWQKDPQASWQKPGFEQTDDHPVVCVSWNDANAFCDWLSEKEGKKYVLPTEAQWEYSCRAGTTTSYHFGDDDEELAHHAWFDKNAQDRTHPVAQKKPNAWGLYDMHGNAWQWVADWHAADYYRRSPPEDPAGPNEGVVRLFRGGDWHFDAGHCQAWIRRHNPPTYGGSNIGFRVVLLR